jgi:transcriptional regulator with XRE-family HTH domain
MNNSPLNTNFSLALNYYKTLRKTTVKDISDALQVPPTTISSWNTGRHLPDMGRLQKLANYLNAPIEQFFEFSIEKMPEKDIIELHNRIDTDEDFVKFLKIFIRLSDENKNLLTTIALKLKN